MGIDYGDKKVGIALSDDSGSMAFPKEVMLNDDQLLENINNIIKKESVLEIVLGDSRNFDGEPNPIMKRINVFKVLLEKLTEISVVFEPELLSTKEARHLPVRSRTQIGGQEDVKIVDASAAAIILQSYIDRKNIHD